MPFNLLSKSKYITGLQCSRLIWIEIHELKNIPETDPVTQYIFVRSPGGNPDLKQWSQPWASWPRSPTIALEMENSISIKVNIALVDRARFSMQVAVNHGSRYMILNIHGQSTNG